MSRSSSLFVAVAATAATGVLGLVSGPAQAISLADIIAGDGYIISGDKKFYDFDFDSTCDNILECTPFEADQVAVDEFYDGNFGIIFNAPFFAEAGKIGDVRLHYTVEVLDPSYWISDVHLWSDFDYPGNGYVNITESFMDMNGNTIVPPLVVDNHPGTPIPVPAVWADLPTPVKKLKVWKDIQFQGRVPGQPVLTPVSFSLVTQTFSQKREVPEPGAVVGLLAIGSLGISQILKRHKQENKN